jgi:hypothetical protein
MSQKGENAQTFFANLLQNLTLHLQVSGYRTDWHGPAAAIRIGVERKNLFRRDAHLHPMVERAQDVVLRVRVRPPGNIIRAVHTSRSPGKVAAAAVKITSSRSDISIVRTFGGRRPSIHRLHGLVGEGTLRWG